MCAKARWTTTWPSPTSPCPAWSGLELARELRALHPGRPVAITSGFIAEELRRLAPAAGIADLIPKPNTCEELFDAIERLASRVCRPALP